MHVMTILMIVMLMIFVMMVMIMMMMSRYFSTSDTAKTPLSRVPPDDGNDCDNDDEDDNDDDYDYDTVGRVADVGGARERRSTTGQGLLRHTLFCHETRYCRDLRAF